MPLSVQIFGFTSTILKLNQYISFDDISDNQSAFKLSAGWNCYAFVKPKESSTICLVNNLEENHLNIEIPGIRSISFSWKDLFAIDGEGICYIWKDSKFNEKPYLFDKTGNNRYTCVSSKDKYTALLTEDGVSGLLLYDEDTFHFEPFNIASKIKSISCGKEHILLLSKIGVVFSYGCGSRGQ